MLVAFVFGCMAGAEALPTLRTETGDVPWTPSLNADNPKVIYGTDDRIDVYREGNAARVSWAASTCAIVYASDLTHEGDGTYTLDTYAYTVYGVGACAGEPFGTQPTAAFCSGFMVGTDLIATAGHCVSASELPQIRFLFGFDMRNASDPVLSFSGGQVYTGVEVVHHGGTGEYDHAIVRMDRAITAPGAKSLELRRTGSLAANETVGVIGHPSGLPKKIAFGANTVVRDNSAAGYFVANLDTYGGNSGSPVFNAVSGAVEGILVRGDQDFVYESTCFRSNTCSNAGGAGEEVTKSSVFASYVPVVFEEDEGEGEPMEGEVGEGEIYEGEDYEGEVFEGEYEPDEGEDIWLLVPNVINLTLDTARAIVEAQELSLGKITEKYNDTVPEGRIISQNPEAGTSVSPGSTIAITVSLGPQFSIVPDLADNELSDAEAALIEAGLVLGVVDEQYSPTVAPGRVIRQEPPAGSGIERNSEVAVTLSLGPEAVIEGEGEGEGENGNEEEGEDETQTGCFGKSLSPDSVLKAMQQAFGDWLLIGLSLLALFAFSETAKGA